MGEFKVFPRPHSESKRDEIDRVNFLESENFSVRHLLFEISSSETLDIHEFERDHHPLMVINSIIASLGLRVRDERQSNFPGWIIF